MITVNNLIFEYPNKRVLHDLSFEISPNTITALVGPNGAGKTTLLRCLAALETPFAGQITLSGIDTIDQPRQCHRQLGYLSDFYGLYDELTVEQNLSYIAAAHLLDPQTIPQRVAEVAKQLNLADRLTVKANELSRGLRQRLAIGQAIIHSPKILLLDEPASGLDPEARHELSALLLALRDQGMTIIVSSHILAELEEYSTDMLVLREGRIKKHESIHQSQEQRWLKLLLYEPFPAITALLESFSTISGIKVEGTSILFAFNGNHQDQHQLIKTLLTQNAPLIELSELKKNFQDVYLAEVHHEKHEKR